MLHKQCLNWTDDDDGKVQFAPDKGLLGVGLLDLWNTLGPFANPDKTDEYLSKLLVLAASLKVVARDFVELQEIQVRRLDGLGVSVNARGLCRLADLAALADAYCANLATH